MVWYDGAAGGVRWLETAPRLDRRRADRVTLADGLLHGFPAYEEFTAESGHGELHVLVGDRFMAVVTVDAADQPTLESAARLIPMQKLAALR